MKAMMSSLGGVCAIQNADSSTRFVRLETMELVPARVAHLIFGVVDDWVSIEASDEEEIIHLARLRFQTDRCVNNVELCLLGCSDNVALCYMEEIEDYIKVAGQANSITSYLLRAPTNRIKTLSSLTGLCLANGMGATARILEEVRDLQPLLRVVVDRWLSLPTELFSAWSFERQSLWRKAVATKTVYKTLLSTDFSTVNAAWMLLALDEKSTTMRAAWIAIAQQMAVDLFPEQKAIEPLVDVYTTDRETKNLDHSYRRQLSPRQAHDRALKQIAAITDAVINGNDSRAKQFLQELVVSQTRQPGDEQYAVKSLCSIAKQCAEAFRTDFEHDCLLAAMAIVPNDGWTLIQFADHLKRVGRFDEAIEYALKAKAAGEVRVALSSLADIKGQMGDFDGALAAYKSIPGSTDDSKIRLSIADLLRRNGLLDDAQREYEHLIHSGLVMEDANRVSAGLAEIAKRQGRLEEARLAYSALIEGDNDPQSLMVYRQALANILVRQGRYREAFFQLDDVVQRQPFARQARARRAAVAGLLGRAKSALRDLPHIGRSSAYNEWVNDYTRGLLLLMLDRHADARRELENQLKQNLLDRESATLVRLGAAVSFLRTQEGVSRASEILNGIVDANDIYVDQLRLALQYHVAIALKDHHDIARLAAILRSSEDKNIKDLVLAIDRRQWARVFKLQAHAILRLAG